MCCKKEKHEVHPKSSENNHRFGEKYCADSEMSKMNKELSIGELTLCDNIRKKVLKKLEKLMMA